MSAAAIANGGVTAAAWRPAAGCFVATMQSISALGALPAGGDVLIAGSLYLAGEVLRLNGEVPE